MNPRASHRLDWSLAATFGLLTVAFILLAATNEGFYTWIWARHHNTLSWYVRPLFLIPFCYFAYRRSLAGVLGTVFALITSMAWFPAPEAVSPQVDQFLEVERQYLFGTWGWSKVWMTLLVPASLYALAAAFWQRSLWFGLSVLVAIAVGKMTWGVAFGGESGWAMLVPASLGLLICVVLVYVGFRRLGRNKAA
ncbi:MAG: hypothetical protein K0R39_500 [Symbiobacteriaceae bacterium]|jgi:hypothetical protein|nr:hypothetical protein [Symbiobacteriaceae bacterium]